MTRVKISHIDEAAIASNVGNETPTNTGTKVKSQITEDEKEEQRLIAHSAALTTIIQRKRIPALTAYLKENSLSPDFPLHPISTHAHTSTLLHLASSFSLPFIVSHILSLGANPELTNAAGKTAYEVAGDRSTRDQFRLARHTQGEQKWNWDLAKVGKPLTPQEFAVRNEREQSQIAAAKAQKAAESKRIADEALKPTHASTGRGGPGSVGTGIPANIANDRGISEELRIKIERERRARAAEARFAALVKK